MKHPIWYEKTRWHRLLGKVLEEWLTPVRIGVQVEFPLLSNPPQADILLLRHEGKGWSEEQRERLADGLRQSRASHLLLEFKYTQSFNESALAQLLA